MAKYYIGNCLRGYYEGEFDDDETAWSWLSTRFLLSYPLDDPESGGGRHVLMFIEKENEYGLTDTVKCRSDYTEINNLKREEVLEKCKSSMFFR